MQLITGGQIAAAYIPFAAILKLEATTKVDPILKFEEVEEDYSMSLAV